MTGQYQWRKSQWRKRAGTIAGMCLLFLLLCTSGCSTKETHQNGEQIAWQTTLLTDVRTGTQFSIAEMNSTPLLIQPFTITCPICMQQQAAISRLYAQEEIPFVMVGLDIDPNGNENSLHDYTRDHEYYGFYARSPPELTTALVDQFGLRVLSPAQAPLILVCPDGKARMLDPGLKSSEDLQRVLTEGCQA